MKKFAKKLLIGAGVVAAGYAAYLLSSDKESAEPLSAKDKAAVPPEYPTPIIVGAESVVSREEPTGGEHEPTQESPIQETPVIPEETQESQAPTEGQQSTDMPE